MADTVLLLAFFTVSGAIVLSLLRSAVRRWQLERAGVPYELPVNYRGAVLRVAAAVLVLAATAAAAGQLLPIPPPRPITAAPSATDDPAGGAAVPDTSPSADKPDAAPRYPIRMPRPSSFPVPQRPWTVGHPARGTLDAFPDGTKVWLPPQYQNRSSAALSFPLIVAHLPEGDTGEDLFQGFAAHTSRGLADPFIVVLAPDCAQNPGPLLKTLGRYYRILTGDRSQGVLGAAKDASCAIDAVLQHPDQYCTAAAVSADDKTVTVPRHLPGADARSAPKPQLLLAAAARDTSARHSAFRLRAALAPFTAPRIVDAVLGANETDDRRRLFAIASQYFTEQLDGPGRPAAGTRRSE